MLHCWLYGKNQIWAETKKLIKKYGTRDPFEIMDQMNIVVGETSRYKTLKGYCFMSCKTIYVMISSFLSEEEKMIVAAHELGHIILHRSQLKMAPMQDDTLYNMTDNTEYQAICLLPIYWLKMKTLKRWFRTKIWIISASAVHWMRLRNSWALNYTAWQNEARLIICRWRFRAISWRNKVNKDPVLYIIVWTGSFYNDLFSI